MTTNPERKKELTFELANYLDEDGWNYINAISHGCTKLVDPGTIVEHKELNYLILQACNYYELVDKEKWTSPLLTALRENREIPTTTDGTIIAAAKEGDVPNYEAIDTMVSFGTTKHENMEQAWTTAVYENNTTSGNLDLQNTMRQLRQDMKFKRSRL